MKIELIEPIVKVVELPTAPPTSLSIGTVTTLAPGDPVTAAIHGLPPSQILDLGIPQGDQGVSGPANSLAIGTVTEGASPDASITGTPPNQTLNLTLPAADPGPPNTLAIGTVVEGPTAGASITGTSPNQTLNLVLPEADPGPPNTLTIGTVGSGASPAASITGTSPNQTLNLTLVPGIGVPTTGNQTGDLLRWNGSVWIQTTTKFHEGTGNPNGVVTAPVGSQFVNTESGGYTGARRWTKATGTGNTGWVVVDGDTGLVNITASSYVSGLHAANVGTIGIRRTATEIRYCLDNLRLDDGATGYLPIISTLPTGWRGDRHAVGYLMRVNSGGLWSRFVYAAGLLAWMSEMNSYTGVATSTRPPVGITGELTVSCVAAWPSTLP